MEIKPKILIVEDEKRISGFIGTVLEANGYSPIYAYTGSEGCSMLSSHCPDLVILDLGLPDMDGMEIIKFARQWTQLPIIVVSARTMEKEKVAALDAGADDYLTKPFGVNELLARVRTALRHFRSSSSDIRTYNDGIFKVKDLVIDYNRHIVSVGGETVHLTQNEYRIVSLLGLHSGRVLTYDYIMKSLWGPGTGESNQVLRVHMANIRRKIEENAADPKYIFTEVGVGYRMADPDD